MTLGCAVFVCPLLVIAALKGLVANETRLSVLPLVQQLQHLANLSHLRECTDLAVLILRLELARDVLGLTEMPLHELLPIGAELPEELEDLDILIPKARSGRGYRQVDVFRTDEELSEFLQHCASSSHSSSIAYIGRGADKAPSSWLVLETADCGRIVLFVRSEKRQGRVGEMGVQGLDEEAAKCWGGGMELKRLLVYVVDELPNNVPPLYEAEAAGLSVVVVGRWSSQQDSLYSHAFALTETCLDWNAHVEDEKQPKGA